MPTLGQYLAKLLYQYDFIVVPDLGAFLTHAQPTHFDANAGQYVPARRRLAFNGALLLDDGVLTHYVSLHENCSRDEARQRIAQHVSALKAQIRQLGLAQLEGIGQFTFNDEGRIQFEPAPRHNFAGASFGLPNVAASLRPNETTMAPMPVVASANVVVADKEAEEPAIVPPVPVAEPTPRPIRRRERPVPVRASKPTEVISADETQSTLVKRYGWLAAVALLTLSAGALSYYAANPARQALQSNLNPATLLRIPEMTTVSAWFAPKAIAKKAPAAAPANETPAQLAQPNVATTSEMPVASPTAAVAATLQTTAPPATLNTKGNETAVTTPTSVAQQTPAPDVVNRRALPTYTVIAGSFSQRGNALRLLRRLRESGYADAYLIRPRRAGELVKVAAFGSSDSAEVEIEKAKIQDVAGTEAWVLHASDV